MSSNLFDNNHIRLMRDSTLWFAAFADPDSYDQPFAKFHYEIDRHLHKNKHTFIIVKIFRGAAKTSLMRAYILQQILWGNSRYAVWVGANRGKANESVEFIRDMAVKKNIKKMFGDPRANSNKWSIDEHFHLANTVKFGKYTHSYDGIIQPIGAGQPLQGSNIGGRRPDLFVLDDIEPPEGDKWSDDMVQKTLRWIDSTVRYSVQDIATSRIFMLGTNTREQGVIGQLSQRPDVYTLKIPVLATNEKMANRYGVGVDCSLWEERFPTEIMHVDRDTKPDFYEQMMLVDNPQGSSRFPMEKIKQFDDIGELPTNTEDLRLCFTIDMAFKVTKDADKSGITAGLWDRGHYLYCLEGRQGKWGTIGTIKRLFEIISFWHHVLPDVSIKVGIESYVWDVVEKEFREHQILFERQNRGVNISLESMKPKGVSKVDRVKAIIPLAEAGRISLYRPKCQELITRLYAFRGKQRRSGDDLEDAFAYQKDIGLRMDMSVFDQPERITSKAWWESKGMKPIIGGVEGPRRIGGIYI